MSCRFKSNGHLTLKFHISDIGWPPQPPKARMPNIIENLNFWWSIYENWLMKLKFPLLLNPRDICIYIKSHCYNNRLKYSKPWPDTLLCTTDPTTTSKNYKSWIFKNLLFYLIYYCLVLLQVQNILGWSKCFMP